MVVRLVYEDREYVRAPGTTLETDLGVLDIPEDVQPGESIESHTGYEFGVRELRPPDYFTHFSRSGAPMLPRDIGLVIGATGIKEGDRVLDAGTGTGILAGYIGALGASVTTFERNPEAAELARENFSMVGLDNAVTVKTGDVRERIEEETIAPVDVVTLDTQDAPAVIESIEELLVPGGYLAVYSPFVEDARAVVEGARKSLTDVRSVETLQRELDVDERGTRPSTRPVGHSGYLTFGRRP